ncbi:MAG: GAF domain-containing protein, partial [Coleofasciculaceae cyanobacterium SM2_3_26]|nr:GAF domain-containing protein [Coleofasciculaceae cyanobacterium SM2_3_26]
MSNLEDILTTAVAEVRKFLEADRVVVYQFEPDTSGRIVAESVLPQWKSCLNAQTIDTCLQEYVWGQCAEACLQAIAKHLPRSIPDIYTAGLSDCHIQLLERFQIEANLVVPILLGNREEKRGRRGSFGAGEMSLFTP